jgi:hypothetical protein
MAGETKKTASKTAKKVGPRKHNPTIDRKHGNKPAGKGTKSQTDKTKKAGLETGAKKLKRNVKKTSPPKKIKEKQKESAV